MRNESHRKYSEDIVGTIFGRLTIISFLGYLSYNDKKGRTRTEPWCVCKCSCGNSEIKNIRLADLLYKGTSSCGCLVSENILKVTKNNIGSIRPCKQKTKDKIRKTLLETYKLRPEILENRKRSGVNQFSGKYSSIEKKIADVLFQMNVAFRHNYPIRRYFADFLIFHNVVIECDGEYWHKDKEKDQRRDEKVMGDGYYIFRLPEKRINENPKKCIMEIIDILQFMGHETANQFNLTN